MRATRKGTNICERASHPFIYKSICDRTYCVFSLRGKRLKIRTDTTLDLCDMECNCCLHCTSENSLHPTLLQMLMQQHYTYLLRQQVLPWSKTLLVVDDSAAGAPFGVPLLASSL